MPEEAGDPPVRRGRHTFEEYSAARRTQGLAFSPDGEEVAYLTNTSGQMNVWKQSVHGGWAWQLTTFQSRSARGLVWPRGDRGIVVMADRDGDERNQLYRVPESGGRAEPLSGAFDAQHILTPWSASPDGRLLAVAANERAAADMDILIFDLDTGDARCLVSADAYHLPGPWSPDAKHLLVIRMNDFADQDLLLVDVESGDQQLLTEHDGEIVNLPGPWSPDGAGFYSSPTPTVTTGASRFVGPEAKGRGSRRPTGMWSPWISARAGRSWLGR